MDIFVGSLLISSTLLRYKRLSASHASLRDYEVYSCEESLSETSPSPSPSSSRKARPSALALSLSLKEHALSILRRHPHRVSASELFDYHGQLQTSSQFFFRNALRVALNLLCPRWSTRYRRELVVLSDGGTVALDWAECEGERERDREEYESRPVVLLLHGILGDAQSEYLYHLVPQLVAQGLRPAVLVARGCGGLSLSSASTFSGRIPADLCEVVQFLKRRQRERKTTAARCDNNNNDNNDNSDSNSKSGKDSEDMFAIGFSLGAIALLHYLAHSGAQSGFTAAVAISPMWDTENALRAPSRIASFWSCLLSLPAKLHLFSHLPSLREMDSDKYASLDVRALAIASSLYEMDRLLFHTFPRLQIVADESESSDSNEGDALRVHHHGHYDDHHVVYRDVSAVHYVHKIATPTLVLCAQDDPICPHRDCPGENNELHVGDSVVVMSVPFGGHLAFPQGFGMRQAWSDFICRDWLNLFR